MEKKDLFKIREQHGLEFEDIRKYLSTLKDVFSDVEAVPFVYGYKQFGPKDWELTFLPPEEEGDKITLMNYIAGVNSVSESIAKGTLDKKDLRHCQLELGIDGRTRENLGDTIISTGFSMQGISYDLYVRWIVPENKGVYSASSKIWTPRVQSVMDRFIGPNIRRSN